MELKIEKKQKKKTKHNETKIFFSIKIFLYLFHEFFFVLKRPIQCSIDHQLIILPISPS
jgi:hypothetical protein